MRVHTKTSSNESSVSTPLSGVLSGVFPRAWDADNVWEHLILDFCNASTDKQIRQIAWLMGRDVFHEFNDPYDLTDEEDQGLKEDSTYLRQQQPQFHAALRWLCSDKDSERSAPGLIERMMKSRRLKWGRWPTISHKDERFVKYFENHGLRHAKLVARLCGDSLLVEPQYAEPKCAYIDFLCAFILNECQGLSLREMPIKICPTCSRLFPAGRATEAHCSDKCRQKAWWTREKRNDYTFVVRLQDMSVKQVRERLEKNTVRDRLEKIEGRYPEWTALQEKLRSVRTAARIGAPTAKV